ncbi:MAG: hypothetical protein VX768_19285 [Planctomycetota bacterium]|nr:hypothetical protein [Planctomycetota bacterium]
MTFFNGFYNNNFGAIHTLSAISNMQNASANRQAAAATQRMAEEQSRARQSQERMEAEQKAHNERMYELEQQKAALKQHQEVHAAQFRQLVVFATAFVDKIDQAV